MPAATFAPPSSDPDIDGLLSGIKWAVSTFTYSFPTSGDFYGSGYSADNEPLNNFEALNSVQRSVVRTVLTGYASVAAITFTELTETSTDHADLRLAESDDPSTAWGYYPHSSSAGGDAWFNNSKSWYDAPVKGSYAYHSFAHELGHNLGLEHGHDASDGDAMLASHDSMEYSVMTYRSYIGQGVGGGYTNESWGYAQTLMMYDIAALQHMYGANYGAAAGDTTYAWNPATGEYSIDGVGQAAPGANRVFMTVWDGGGTDTYDFSDYSAAVRANLTPGAWTTTAQAQRAYLGGGQYAEGNVANSLLYQGDLRSLIENVYGGAGSDTLIGNQAANVMQGRAGNDSMVGGAGDDHLDGGLGGDTMQGGSGDDAYAVEHGLDSVIEYSGEGNDVVHTDLSYTLGNNVEGLTLLGSVALTGTGNALDNVITGTVGSDAMIALAGNDRLDGGLGADTMRGGDGYDVYVVDHSLDVVVEIAGEGIDTVYADISYTLGNAVERLVLTSTAILNGTGNALDNIITGNANGNWLDPLSGGDTLIGGAGDDVYSIDHSLDVVLENVGEGTDSVHADINYTLGPNVEYLALAGSFSLTGTGNELDNRISGTAAGDVLIGGGGADRLHGGGGADTLTGGTGIDTFHYGSMDEGVDMISDFTSGHGGDALDFRDVLVGYMQDSSSVSSFVQLEQSGGSTTVSVNADGSGAGFVDMTTLQGVTALLLGDMVAQGNLLLA